MPDFEGNLDSDYKMIASCRYVWNDGLSASRFSETTFNFCVFQKIVRIDEFLCVLTPYYVAFLFIEIDTN